EQADDMAEGRSGHDGDDIVRELEAEELEREGDQGPSKVRRRLGLILVRVSLNLRCFPGDRLMRRYCMIMERRILRDA
ncbi:hypothetical protein A2U01_0088567, partial [Trifolium medium]|nr:hypothetical protein [Trifolium medium]